MLTFEHEHRCLMYSIFNKIVCLDRQGMVWYGMVWYGMVESMADTFLADLAVGPRPS